METLHAVRCTGFTKFTGLIIFTTFAGFLGSLFSPSSLVSLVSLVTLVIIVRTLNVNITCPSKHFALSHISQLKIASLVNVRNVL